MRFLHACAMALFACALAVASSARADDGLRIAVTIDDLPWVNLNPLPGEAAAPVPAHIVAAQAKLLAALKASDVPVVGFVNCGKLYAGTTVLPERMALLENWRDAGIELGNHTGFHSDLHKVGLAAFEADVGNCDADLRRWFPDTPPRWFRHPYLHTGMNAADKAASEAFLGGLGERIAPVTVAADDWTWALAYRKALADGDVATQAKLREAYVGFTLMTLRHFEIRAKRLLGRPLVELRRRLAIVGGAEERTLRVARRGDAGRGLHASRHLFPRQRRELAVPLGRGRAPAVDLRFGRTDHSGLGAGAGRGRAALINPRRAAIPVRRNSSALPGTAP